MVSLPAAALRLRAWAAVSALAMLAAPPASSARPSADLSSAPSGLARCRIEPDSPLILLYTGVGGAATYGFLEGCPGEVVVGGKGEKGPKAIFRDPAARAAGLRTAYILGDFGKEIRARLRAPQGVARTLAYLKERLAAGYDYILIDEVTTDPEWADDNDVNRRMRELLERLPGKIIAYISLDLTIRPHARERLRERRLLLDALRRHGRALALEVYLHTDEVMDRGAERVFGEVADNLAHAVEGLPGPGINRKAITVLGITTNAKHEEYRYLNRPKQDLASIKRQARYLRRAGERVRRQRGIGFYFVGLNDLAPVGGAPYSQTQLARLLMRTARH